MNTKVHRSAVNGLYAETHIPLWDKQYLTIHTTKGSDKHLRTSVSVQKIEDGVMSFIMFQDYSKIAARTKVRVTANAVAEQHEQVMRDVDKYLRDVEFHYNRTVEAQPH